MVPEVAPSPSRLFSLCLWCLSLLVVNWQLATGLLEALLCSSSRRRTNSSPSFLRSPVPSLPFPRVVVVSSCPSPLSRPPQCSPSLACGGGHFGCWCGHFACGACSGLLLSSNTAVSVVSEWPLLKSLCCTQAVSGELPKRERGRKRPRHSSSAQRVSPAGC